MAHSSASLAALKGAYNYLDKWVKEVDAIATTLFYPIPDEDEELTLYACSQLWTGLNNYSEEPDFQKILYTTLNPSEVPFELFTYQDFGANPVTTTMHHFPMYTREDYLRIISTPLPETDPPPPPKEDSIVIKISIPSSGSREDYKAYLVNSLSNE